MLWTVFTSNKQKIKGVIIQTSTSKITNRMAIKKNRTENLWRILLKGSKPHS